MSDPEKRPMSFPEGRGPRIMIMAAEGDGFEDDAAEDDGGGSASEFIVLGGGRYFVKKWAIDGMAWEPHYDIDHEGPPGWRLVVVFADFKINLFGEEAGDVLEQFGLPRDPPVR